MPPRSKIIIGCLCFIASSLVLANDSTYGEHYSAYSLATPNVYTTLFAGYAWQAWGDAIDGTTSTLLHPTPSSVGNGTFNIHSAGGEALFGANAGYNFNADFALELGGFITLNNEANQRGGMVNFTYYPNYNDASASKVIQLKSSQLKVSQWLVYAGAQIKQRISARFTSFFVVGFAYSLNTATLNYKSITTPAINNHQTLTNDYWLPYFAAGLTFQITPNLYTSIRYRHLTGYHSSLNSDHNFIVPTMNGVTAGIGYRYSTG